MDGWVDGWTNKPTNERDGYTHVHRDLSQVICIDLCSRDDGSRHGSCMVLESKLQEAKAKKDTLKARAASAKSTKEINDMLGNLSDSSNSYVAFEKMEEKVVAMEAESEAAGMLNPSKDDLESKFAMLEGGVDTELRSDDSGREARDSFPGRMVRDVKKLDVSKQVEIWGGKCPEVCAVNCAPDTG
eukprot:scaffold84934_cov56-Prasinocladus_malaysianus.AAC.2